MDNFLDRASRSFFTGLFAGAGFFIAYLLYGAVNTAFWYYVATTAQDQMEYSNDYQGEYIYEYNYKDDLFKNEEAFAFRLGNEWPALDSLRDTLRRGPQLEDFYID